MSLHRASQIPDWEKIDPSLWNEAQKRAAETNGWDTPGNRETAKGAVTSALGLWAFAKQKPFLGTALLAWGRWRDVRDGRIADETGTKSPQGEIIDATTDRLILAAAIPVLHKEGIINDLETKVLTVEGSVNAVASGVAKFLTKRDIHPSRIGKYFAFASWTGLVALGLGRGLEQHAMAPEAQEKIQKLGHGLLGLGLAGGGVASIGYVRDAVAGTPVQEIASVSFQA